MRTRPAHAFLLACLITGCGSHPKLISEQDVLVRKYEDWLRTQSKLPRSATGRPRSPADLVFDTDLRTQPGRGFSKAHLRQDPANIWYIYGGDVNRLLSASFSDGLAPVVVPGGRYGYIRESGEWAFPPAFRAANPFDQGVATAQTADLAWVLLDAHGGAHPLDPSINWIHGFSAGLAAFTGKNRRTGYLDHAGTIRIPASFTSGRDFCEDATAPVRHGTHWGLIDTRGDFVVQPAFQDIRCFAEGLAAARRVQWGFIDRRTAFVVPPQFEGVGDFSEGLATFRNPARAYGYIDRTGKVVIQAGYDAAFPFHFGIAKVGTRKMNWRIYPLSFIVPADPHYTAWTHIAKPAGLS